MFPNAPLNKIRTKKAGNIVVSSCLITLILKQEVFGGNFFHKKTRKKYNYFLKSFLNGPDGKEETAGALAGTRSIREEEDFNQQPSSGPTDKKPASLDVSPEEQAILNIIEKQNNEIATIETPAKSTINIQYSKPRDVGLTKNNQNELKKLAKLVLINPRSRVLIESHSDNFGSISENFEITQKRADEIGKFLINQGLRPEQIISHPKGSLSPIDNNRTEDGRKRNRRSIVKIIEK